jgi:beta-glucanase (GH16 family)
VLVFSRRSMLVAVLTAVVCGGQPSAQSSGIRDAGSGIRNQTAPSATRTGTLVFSDEFDKPGPPDPAKWGYELGYIRNNEKQYYTSRRENVRVEGGNLVIEGRKEAYQGFAYTSASINTEGHFEFKYGRVEVRAKLPAGVGMWPAIWTLGTNRRSVGWPACGEIDIMENVGFEPARIHGSVHSAAYNHIKGTQKTATIDIADLAGEFHVYAMDWTPDRIDMFVDGKKYFTFANERAGSAVWPFDAPQYLLINLAIGGAWGGQKGIDDARFPAQYLIDYVRIYKNQ